MTSEGDARRVAAVPSGALEVTVIVPTLNEAGTIEACLDALAVQDVGPERLELIVVDGPSADGTLAVVERFLTSRPQPVFGASKLLSHGAASRPASLNRGLKEATCPVICRVDARSRVPVHYISRCRDTLVRRPDVRVVGGRQRAVAQSTIASLGIARALNNRWAMGGARYRRNRIVGPADTVYLGTFRTNELRASGGWNETLLVNEDFELNRRIGAGGGVWFDPALEVEYAPRTSIRALAVQYWDFGRWKARYLRWSGDRPQLRQALVIGGAPVLVALGLGTFANRRLRVIVGSAAVLLTAAVEELGADSPAAPLAGHLVAAVTSIVIAGAWVGGVWAELLRPTGDDSQADGTSRIGAVPSS